MATTLMFGLGNLPDDYVLDCPDVKLVLFTEAQIIELIDEKLVGPEWEQVLKLDKLPAKPDDPAKEPGKEPPKEPEEVEFPQYDGILNKFELPAKKTRGMWDGEAYGMGLEDRYQLLATRKIVRKQQLSILPVKGGGNCMMNAILGQLSFKDKTDLAR